MKKPISSGIQTFGDAKQKNLLTQISDTENIFIEYNFSNEPTRKKKIHLLETLSRAGVRQSGHESVV